VGSSVRRCARIDGFATGGDQGEKRLSQIGIGPTRGHDRQEPLASYGDIRRRLCLCELVDVFDAPSKYLIRQDAFVRRFGDRHERLARHHRCAVGFHPWWFTDVRCGRRGGTAWWKRGRRREVNLGVGVGVWSTPWG